MSSSSMLKGIDLIDCARANAKQGVETAARLCGYGDDITQFQHELQQACHNIGVEISQLSDLITDPQTLLRQGGVEFAPDDDSSL